MRGGRAARRFDIAIARSQRVRAKRGPMTGSRDEAYLSPPAPSFQGASETSKPAIHNRHREYGFRGCAWRLMADAGENAGIGDLVAVQVQDRENRAVGHRVQEFVRMPARCQWSSLRFAV